MRFSVSRLIMILGLAMLLICLTSAPTLANNAGGLPAKGSPVWSVNKLNMNLYITDIPLWYAPAVGPEVEIQLSYNSQDDIVSGAPFGPKWQLNYGSHINADQATGKISVFMPDGRKDVFTPDGQGGYISPKGIFNALTRISANHFQLTHLDGTAYTYQIPSGTTLTNPVLVEIKDHYNQKVTIGYNATNQLSTVTDALGKLATFQYYPSGLIRYIDDPFGRRAEFGYTDGTLSMIKDMEGYSAEFAYAVAKDGNTYLSGITKKGKSGQAQGTWTIKTEPNDGIPNNANPYPAPGGDMWENYRITITSPPTADYPAGAKEEYYYFGPYTWYVSPNDYVTYVDAKTNNYRLAKKTTYIIDRTAPKGRIKQIRYPEGGYIKYSNFDPVTNKPRAVTDYHGKDASNNPITHTTHYTYNANGLVTSVTDARGKTTTIEYHPNNIDVWKLANPLGSIEFTYNGSTHDIKTIKDRLGTITEFTYNGFGRLTKIEEAKGTPIQLTTELIYNPTTYRVTDIKKGGSGIASFTYDTVGRVWTLTGPTGVTTTYEYNNLDQLTKIIFPDAKYIQIDRSPLHPHLIDRITDRSGLVTGYFHDALNRLTQVQGPNGPNDIMDFKYDKNGNLTKIIDQERHETTFEYNYDDLLTKKTYHDQKAVFYSPDKLGLPKTVTNARNTTKTYTFDANHNLTNISYNDNPVTPAVTFEYDDFNRLTKRTDGTGQTLFTYYADDRLETVDGPLAGDTLTYQYNALGNLIAITPEQGQPVSYKYDYDSGIADIDLGRLKSITAGSNTYTYDYTGVNPLIQRLTRPNGSYTEHQYNDPLKRLTALINKASTGSLINSFAYTYEKDLIKTETVTNGSIIDNFLEKTTTYVPNAVNQLVSATTAPNPAKLYAYDNDGNMTTGYTPEGYALTMTHDAQNRMKTAQYTDGSSVLQKSEYIWSGNSLLAEMKKYQNGVLTADSKYLRAGFLPVQERDASNAITREYTWGMNLGGGIGGLLHLKQGGQDYSYLYDGKGNVSALIDFSQGVVASYAYDPFGQQMKETSTIDQPYRFSTKEAQSGTGQYYYGYRFYDSCLGKWTTRDPLGEEGGWNLYGFVGNNPVNFVDPLGLIYVIYEQGLNRISVFSNEMEFYAQYEARNSVTRGSNGQFPAGEYSFGAPRGPRGKTNRTTGNWFIPILNVPGRQDMGLHGGGSCAGSRAFEDRQQWCSTLGCIRMQNEDVDIIAGLIAWERRNNRSSKILILPAYPAGGFGR